VHSSRLVQLDRALEDANKTIKLAPKHAFVYRSRALIFGAMKSYDNAINDMTTAISLDHEWIDLLVERGKRFAKSRQI
jgi:regulator of sirC expression with transglutaminase-like and TPR domain